MSALPGPLAGAVEPDPVPMFIAIDSPPVDPWPLDAPVNHETKELRNAIAARTSTPITAAEMIQIRRRSPALARGSGSTVEVGSCVRVIASGLSFESVIVHLPEYGLRPGRARRAGDRGRRACARSPARRRAADARP